jgi:hypothetical protein
MIRFPNFLALLTATALITAAADASYAAPTTKGGSKPTTHSKSSSSKPTTHSSQPSGSGGPTSGSGSSNKRKASPTPGRASNSNKKNKSSGSGSSSHNPNNSSQTGSQASNPPGKSLTRSNSWPSSKKNSKTDKKGRPDESPASLSTEDPKNNPNHYSNKQWTSPGNEDSHYQKHKNEFPGKNKAGYSDGAKKLVANNTSRQQKVDPNTGKTSHYDPKSNTFAVTNNQGKLVTAFKPSAGQKYMDKQPGTAPPAPSKDSFKNWKPKTSAKPGSSPSPGSKGSGP